MVVVPGDGNCFYWALSTYLGRSNVEIRDAAVVDIINNPEFYRNYIIKDDGIENYVSDHSELGEYADHLTIQATANAFGVNLQIIESDGSLRLRLANGEWTDAYIVYHRERVHDDATTVSLQGGGDTSSEGYRTFTIGAFAEYI